MEAVLYLEYSPKMSAMPYAPSPYLAGFSASWLLSPLYGHAAMQEGSRRAVPVSGPGQGRALGLSGDLCNCVMRFGVLSVTDKRTERSHCYADSVDLPPTQERLLHTQERSQLIEPAGARGIIRVTQASRRSCV